MLIPLTLTLLSAAVSPQRRGLALGAWGAVGGLAIAIGPLVGGAVVEGSSWQWRIFWLNVPIGIAVLPIARLPAHREPRALNQPGSAGHWSWPASACIGIVLGVVRGNDHGGTNAHRPAAAGDQGAARGRCSSAGNCGHASRCCRCTLFRSRGFAVTNLASLLMFFGMFGSIFLLAQFLQVVQHYSPLQAGAADAALDRHAGAHRPDRGRAVRPHRRAYAAGYRAGPAGHRTRLAGRGHQPHRALPHVGPGVRRLRRRHVPVLRAGRQRRAQLGAPRPGGHRIRREQRDQGTRRRVRDRRARRCVRRARQLRERNRLRLRARARRLGRRRGRGRRLGGRCAVLPG